MLRIIVCLSFAALALTQTATQNAAVYAATTCQACADASVYSTTAANNYGTYWCVGPNTANSQSATGWTWCTTQSNCTNGATTYWPMYDFSACVAYSSYTTNDDWTISGVNQQTKSYTVAAGANKWWVITNSQTYVPVTCSSISSCASAASSAISGAYQSVANVDNLSNNAIRIQVQGGAIPSGTEACYEAVPGGYYPVPPTSSNSNSYFQGFSTSQSGSGSASSTQFGTSSYMCTKWSGVTTAGMNPIIPATLYVAPTTTTTTTTGTTTTTVAANTFVAPYGYSYIFFWSNTGSGSATMTLVSQNALAYVPQMFVVLAMALSLY